MEQTLAYFDAEHGGVKQFLLTRLGMNEDTVSAIQLNLLV
jgi:hypothetical protein